MKKILFALMGAMAVSGCTTIKFVTARTWVGGDTLYVAYTDHTKGLFVNTSDARVLRCSRNPSNMLACGEEQQLTRLLNEGSSTSSGQ